jgi:hypothetical protein
MRMERWFFRLSIGVRDSNMTAKEIRDNLTEAQVTKVVMALGSAAPHEADGALAFQTVCHHGDSFKLYYFKDTKFFHCFTHCKENFDIFELVRRSKGFASFVEAYRWTLALLRIPLTNDGQEEQDIETADEWDYFRQIDLYDKAAQQTTNQIESVPEGVLNYFGPFVAPSEWLHDGISAEVMQYYGIRIDTAEQKIIIPHRDINGRLIGIRCRNYDPEALEEGCKYMPEVLGDKMYTHPLGQNLFGLYQNQHTIQRLHKVLVCESEKSVMQCATMYGLNNNFCVATCGHSLSSAQADLLLGLGVSEIILGYDHDVILSKGSPSTVAFEKELYDIIQPYSPYFSTEMIIDYDNILGLKHSPTDDGRAKLEYLMKNKVYVSTIGN